jgi:hypothetical protein
LTLYNQPSKETNSSLLTHCENDKEGFRGGQGLKQDVEPQRKKKNFIINFLLVDLNVFINDFIIFVFIIIIIIIINWTTYKISMLL